MKKIVIALFALFTLSTQSFAQSAYPEKFGRTLNLAAGIGYYGPSSALPMLHLNYEFDVFRNFTLAPFISVLTHRGYTYWGSDNFPYRNYSYRETVIPMGLKGTYYFDELFKAGPKWDFYVGTSVGFAYSRVTWENGYYGGSTARLVNPFYVAMHIGSEYHMSSKAGVFLDLSNNVSTIGFGFHF